MRGGRLDALAFGAHCERHEDADDRARLAAVEDALLRAGHAEEVWLAALREALEAERVAGIRRANPP